MTRRERRARERVIAAVLAIAELEATFGAQPAAGDKTMIELCAAGRGLRQVVIVKGRRGAAAAGPDYDAIALENHASGDRLGTADAQPAIPMQRATRAVAFQKITARGCRSTSPCSNLLECNRARCTLHRDRGLCIRCTEAITACVVLERDRVIVGPRRGRPSPPLDDHDLAEPAPCCAQLDHRLVAGRWLRAERRLELGDRQDGGDHALAGAALPAGHGKPRRRPTKGAIRLWSQHEGTAGRRCHAMGVRRVSGPVAASVEGNRNHCRDKQRARGSAD